MNNWSIDILRQGNWDLWTLLCILASGALGLYATVGGVRRAPVLTLCAAGILGTLGVLLIPALRTPLIGMGWTFVLLSILSTVFYLNLRSVLPPRRVGILLLMRIAALALLVPMLFEPVVRYVARPAPQRPLLFVIDTSGSMSVPDVQNGPTRLQSVWQALQPQLSRVRDHFVPKFFTFSTGAQPLADPNQLATMVPDGPSTDMVGALNKALPDASHPDASVILLSDGIDNTSPDVLLAIRSAQRPVHTIVVGSSQAEPATLVNIAVTDVQPKDELFVHHQTPIVATVQSTALNNRVVEVKLARVDADGTTSEVLSTARLVLQPLVEGQRVELPFTPTAPGVQRLAIWVDPVPGERSVVDNRQEFQGLALDPRIKVLYIEGRARPEYRELVRALQRDPNVELGALLRIQGDRFTASGSVDGQPLHQLPAAETGWSAFDVILLGDLDSSFLTTQQQQGIEKVIRSGKGLLMIGGQTSFGPGGYGGTPIEAALPVFVGDKSAAQETTPFVPRLTASGASHPAMQGLADWFGSEGAGSDHPLPALRGNVVVQKSKSGAQVLLVHPDRPGPDGDPQIVLAVQRYGEGRSAAFTADTTYLWYLPLRGMGQDSPYNRFWGQLIRWLAGSDTRHRQQGPGVEALLNKSLYQLGDSVRIRAMVRDERGDATRYAQVNAALKQENQPDRTFALQPVESHLGLYDLTIPALGKGTYTAMISASKEGKALGEQTLSFAVIPPADEMLKLAANPTLLSAIADQTHGFHYPLSELPTLIDELIRRDPDAGRAVQKSIPLSNTLRAGLSIVGFTPDWPSRYDLPMQGVLVVGVLAGEWVLRRKWQLA